MSAYDYRCPRCGSGSVFLLYRGGSWVRICEECGYVISRIEERIMFRNST